MNLELQEWEIWHTYTTYLDCTGLDLLRGARSLVESEVAQCAMLNDGKTFWGTDNGICSGITTIEIDTQNGNSYYKLVLDDKSQSLPAGFATEAWGQSAYFLIAEQRVLGESRMQMMDPYLRAYLGKCVVSIKDNDGTISQLNLYPILVVHQSGVLILEFRVIGPKGSVSLERFIEDDVNLFREHFSQVEVSPGLARNATAAYYRTAASGIFKRIKLAWHQSQHDLAIRKLTRKTADDSFSFELSPWSGEADTLQSIALSIFHTSSLLLIGPRRGLAYILLGQPIPPSLGEYWSGRPHIHLIRFQDQRETAGVNETCYTPEFTQILARSSSPDPDGRLQLPANARLFGDYGAYITSASTLCVWSTRGLKSQEDQLDANRGNFIYERQRVLEVLEYGYMLHRGLYHRVEQLGTTEQVMAIRKHLLNMRLQMREASNAGEIRELLDRGWKEFGLPELTFDIESALALRESEMRSQDNVRATRVGWAIAIVFGFVAVPGLADQIVMPAWKLLGIWTISDDSVAKLISGGVSIVLIFFVLMLSLSTLSLFGRWKR